jgi:hypothetical protein
MTHSRAHPCRLASCAAASIKAVPASRPPGGLGDKRRMIHRVNQLSQPGSPQAVVPGQERLGRSLVGSLPRTDPHRINVTARE